MPVAEVRVTAVGACTPIGRDAWSSAAAARAGVCGFREHPYLLDSAGEPIRVGSVPWLDVAIPHGRRLAAMLFSAVDEALRSASVTSRFDLVLALPAPRPGLSADFASTLVAQVEERYGSSVNVVRVFESGHAAPLSALHLAGRRIVDGARTPCLVASVDSYLTAATLGWLEECDQLHGAGPLNNAWGFVPGEAAAAMMLGRADPTEVPGIGDVLSVGLGIENERIKTDTVCTGQGLTDALRAALLPLPAGTIVSNVYCDMNGEAYRADEYGFSALRTKEWFENASRFVAPADCWGDVGAAGATLNVLLALAACRKGYALGPLSLVWASSENGDRAATVLHAPVQLRE